MFLKAKIVLMGLFASSFAFANGIELMTSQWADIPTNTNLTTTNGSRYEKLIEHFDQSSLPTFSEIEGWWAGRCYTQPNPNMPIATVLVARMLELPPQDNTNNGPLFPGPTPKTVMNIGLIVSNGVSVPADFYDTLTPETSQQVEDVLQTADFQSIVARMDAKSIISTYDRGNLEFSLRKFNNYVFLKAAVLRDDRDHKAGNIYASCYFFKKIRK